MKYQLFHLRSWSPDGIAGALAADRREVSLGPAQLRFDVLACRLCFIVASEPLQRANLLDLHFEHARIRARMWRRAHVERFAQQQLGFLGSIERKARTSRSVQ